MEPVGQSVVEVARLSEAHKRVLSFLYHTTGFLPGSSQQVKSVRILSHCMYVSRPVHPHPSPALRPASFFLPRGCGLARDTQSRRAHPIPSHPILVLPSSPRRSRVGSLADHLLFQQDNPAGRL